MELLEEDVPDQEGKLKGGSLLPDLSSDRSPKLCRMLL